MTLPVVSLMAESSVYPNVLEREVMDRVSSLRPSFSNSNFLAPPHLVPSSLAVCFRVGRLEVTARRQENHLRMGSGEWREGASAGG